MGPSLHDPHLVLGRRCCHVDMEEGNAEGKAVAAKQRQPHAVLAADFLQGTLYPLHAQPLGTDSRPFRLRSSPRERLSPQREHQKRASIGAGIEGAMTRSGAPCETLSHTGSAQTQKAGTLARYRLLPMMSGASPRIRPHEWSGRGFEPPTPASRTQYSTRLSYAPILASPILQTCALALLLLLLLLLPTCFTTAGLASLPHRFSLAISVHRESAEF